MFTASGSSTRRNKPGAASTSGYFSSKPPGYAAQATGGAPNALCVMRKHGAGNSASSSARFSPNPSGTFPPRTTATFHRPCRESASREKSANSGHSRRSKLPASANVPTPHTGHSASPGSVRHARTAIAATRIPKIDPGPSTNTTPRASANRAPASCKTASTAVKNPSSVCAPST